MAQIIYPDNTDNSVRDVEPANGTDFTLSELQAHLGGIVSILPLKEERIMVLNRDAHFLVGMTYNRTATNIIAQAHGSIGRIVGPALICANEEVK